MVESGSMHRKTVETPPPPVPSFSALVNLFANFLGGLFGVPRLMAFCSDL